MFPRLHVAKLATRRIDLARHLVGGRVRVRVRVRVRARVEVRVRVRVRVRADLGWHPVASYEERIGPL